MPPPLSLSSIRSAIATLQDFVAHQQTSDTAKLLRWINRAKAFRKEVTKLRRQNERLTARVVEYEAIFNAVAEYGERSKETA